MDSKDSLGPCLLYLGANSNRHPTDLMAGETNANTIGPVTVSPSSISPTVELVVPPSVSPQRHQTAGVPLLYQRSPELHENSLPGGGQESIYPYFSATPRKDETTEREPDSHLHLSPAHFHLQMSTEWEPNSHLHMSWKPSSIRPEIFQRSYALFGPIPAEFYEYGDEEFSHMAGLHLFMAQMRRRLRIQRIIRDSQIREIISLGGPWSTSSF